MLLSDKNYFGSCGDKFTFYINKKDFGYLRPNKSIYYVCAFVPNSNKYFERDSLHSFTECYEYLQAQFNLNPVYDKIIFEHVVDLPVHDNYLNSD